MLNFFILIVIFILLVTQKILLLNEESLILLCFIVFVNLGITKLGVNFNNFLNGESTEIKTNLIKSLKSILKILRNFELLRQISQAYLEKLSLIKNYYKNWILRLSSYFLIYNKNILLEFYKKKLHFLYKIENQTTKLLTIMIVKKLNFFIKTKFFYMNSIKINQFLSFNHITTRECIYLINAKNIN